MKAYDYYIDCEVRDYELDVQGIVNNSVYHNYFEHCRHCYLRELGLDFFTLHSKGYDAVLVRSEIDYIQPLRSGDTFTVGLKMSFEGRLRYIFHQEIACNNSIVSKARVTATILQNGTPVPFPDLQRVAENYRIHKKISPMARLK